MATTGSGAKGFIKCYGMFWDRHDINWSPGSGNWNEFRLLGRAGKNRPGIKVCDFRSQRGIYVLWNNHGAYYVGLARDQDIGQRLKQHTADHHGGKWERFSWFGFRGVLARTEADGTRQLGKVPDQLLSNSASTIGDIEALLIQTLGTYGGANRQQAKFASAEEWHQVRHDERDLYLGRL